MRARKCSCGHIHRYRFPKPPDGRLGAAMGALQRKPEIREALPTAEVLDAVRWGA